MKLRSTKGFSLVELIIVIAIMGIIAVIAIPNLTGIQTRTQVNADIRTAETIARSVATCIAEDRTNSTGASVNTKLAAAWTELGGLDAQTGIDMDDYVDTTLTPKSLDSGKYFVKFVEGQDASGNKLAKRVVVVIGTAATGSSASIASLPYDGEFAASTTAEVACINGIDLDTTNATAYNR